MPLWLILDYGWTRETVLIGVRLKLMSAKTARVSDPQAGKPTGQEWHMSVLVKALTIRNRELIESARPLVVTSCLRRRQWGKKSSGRSMPIIPSWSILSTSQTRISQVMSSWRRSSSRGSAIISTTWTIGCVVHNQWRLATQDPSYISISKIWTHSYSTMTKISQSIASTLTMAQDRQHTGSNVDLCGVQLSQMQGTPCWFSSQDHCHRFVINHQGRAVVFQQYLQAWIIVTNRSRPILKLPVASTKWSETLSSEEPTSRKIEKTRSSMDPTTLEPTPKWTLLVQMSMTRMLPAVSSYLLSSSILPPWCRLPLVKHRSVDISKKDIEIWTRHTAWKTKSGQGQ